MITTREIWIPTPTGLDVVTLYGDTPEKQAEDEAQHRAAASARLIEALAQRQIRIKEQSEDLNALASVCHGCLLAEDAEADPEAKRERFEAAIAACDALKLDAEVKASFEVLAIETAATENAGASGVLR